MIILAKLKTKLNSQKEGTISHTKKPNYHIQQGLDNLQIRKPNFVISNYTSLTSLAFILIALFSYNLPEKYQLANLINTDNVETPQRGVSTGNQNQSQSQASTKQGLMNQPPTTSISTSGQSVVLAETIVNDQVAFAKATADQGKKTLQMAGSLTGKDGKPVEGTYPIRFAIYTKDRNTLDPAPSDTDQNQRIWEETRDITFKNGLFQVELGEVTDLPIITENSNQLFIGMKVNTDSEMVPRKKISTPLFSFNAGNSITLNGKKIGTNSGDIPILNENGQININNLPIGTNSDQLVLGNDKRLNDPLTISGAKYITIANQKLTLKKINLNSDTQGNLNLSQGGTGLTSYTQGDLSYYKESTTLTKLPIGSENQILSITNGLPAWQNSQATNYTKSGNLLQLSNNNFSIKEGTLTNAKLCTYDTTAGIVCNTDPAGAGVETDPTISAWAKNATKPTYTATEIGLGNVPNLTFSGSNTGDQDLTGLVHTNRTALDLISNTNTGDETQTTIKTKLGSATTTLDGYLTTTDWNIFNNKQPALGFTPYNATNPNNYISTYSETDPIFTAWNRSTGLTVTESQISDLKTYLTVETDPIWTANKTSYSTKTVADGLYLGITAKATDSDTLDNHDTSYFQTNLGFTPYNATNPNNYLSTIDISTNTNLAVSGTLLNLTGDTLSIKEGTLTNTKLCTYDTTAGLVCDTSTSSVGHTPATINATPNGLSIDGSQIISLALASTSTIGALNSTDWNTFFGKQSSLGFTPYDATNPNSYVSFATILTVDGTGSGLDADKLDGFDSSAFGDATAANQMDILARIGTNADAASLSSTLFAGQKSLDNKLDIIIAMLAGDNPVVAAVAASSLSINATDYLVDISNRGNLGQFFRYIIGPPFDSYKDLTNFNAILNNSEAMVLVAGNLTAMNIVINSMLISASSANGVVSSVIAMNAIASSSIAMTAVAASSVAMTAIASSSIAMNAIAESSIAMNAIASSSVAMTAITASSSAMNYVAISSTARSIIGTSGTAFDFIKVSNMAIGKYSIGFAGLEPTGYLDMTAVATSSVAMTAIASSSSAMTAIASSSVAVTPIVSSGVALKFIASNSNASSIIESALQSNRTTIISTLDAASALFTKTTIAHSAAWNLGVTEYETAVNSISIPYSVVGYTNNGGTGARYYSVIASGNPARSEAIGIGLGTVYFSTGVTFRGVRIESGSLCNISYGGTTYYNQYLVK